MSRLAFTIVLSASMWLALPARVEAQLDFSELETCDLDTQWWYALGQAHTNPIGALPLLEKKELRGPTDETVHELLKAYIQELALTRKYNEAEQNRQGLEMLRSAASRGHPSAQFALGAAYRDAPLGVVKNEAEAVKWFKRAAYQGHPLAMVAYGAGSAKLVGSVNAEEMYFWLLLAKANANAPAYPEGSEAELYWKKSFPVLFEKFESTLTAAERISAQKRAGQWSPVAETDFCP
ncbi:MAG: hypothetical protein C0421_01755 [Hyphomonas sp.]|uniref:tetratricopeptide repeat protein n=1 Tax=Hyphomonas sp. TaxID=87 RepID=UPI0025C29FA2|nr:hypothetical protein [Hyphomonas sp.]MBA4337552.1 hypothetical protein [Hyphomonas sp.]